MYIEIEKKDVVKQEEIGQGDKTYYFQSSLIHFDSKRFPLELRISLTAQQEPYPEGYYEIGENCWSVDQYDKLKYNQFKLNLVKIDKPN